MKFILPILLFATSVFGQWTPDMDSLAKKTECEFKLPKGTCRAFALQESNYNPFAERVEANYVERTGTYAKNIRKAAHKFSKEHNYTPSVLTEIYQQGKSITMFQIMTANLRAMGYEEPYVNHMPLENQFFYFGKFISKLYIKHDLNIAAAAAEYNGGYGAVKYKKTHRVYRNQPYVNNIIKYIEQFSRQTDNY